MAARPGCGKSGSGPGASSCRTRIRPASGEGRSRSFRQPPPRSQRDARLFPPPILIGLFFVIFVFDFLDVPIFTFEAIVVVVLVEFVVILVEVVVVVIHFVVIEELVLGRLLVCAVASFDSVVRECPELFVAWKPFLPFHGCLGQISLARRAGSFAATFRCAATRSDAANHRRMRATTKKASAVYGAPHPRQSEIFGRSRRGMRRK